MAKPKPIHCPFCGHPKTKTDAWGEGFAGRTERFVGVVKCRYCGGSMRAEFRPSPDTTTREGCAAALELAIERWNERVGKEVGDGK
jgi:sarcosine oxidase delta subunit